MPYEEEEFKAFLAPLSLAPRNPGAADTAYTSATFGVLHMSISVALRMRRALKRIFTGGWDCVRNTPLQND